MYVVIVGESSPNILSGEILIVTHILSISGLRNYPQEISSRYMADIDTAKSMLSSDIIRQWQFGGATATKILLQYNGSSKEFVGNPLDILELKSVLLT